MIHYLIAVYETINEAHVVALLKEFEADLELYFKDHPIEIIVEEFIRLNNKISLNILTQDPSGLLQIASLTNAIYLRLAEDLDTERIIILKRAFQNSLAKQVLAIVEKSKPQLIGLTDFLKRIADQCVATNIDFIYIVELPIGNSIPSFLLKKILMSKGKESHLISISINRNDSKSKGITRKQLLNTQIEKLDLDYSLVVYLDEWITGSNFNNILTLLSKIPNLKLLGGAFLVPESKEHARYSEYKNQFDHISKMSGFDNEELLVELPGLNQTIDSQQKFIWAEFDRIAGYRKLDFWGSIISTFFAVGEALIDSPQLLQTTLREAISEHTNLDPETRIPQDFKDRILASFQYFNSTFVSDLEAKMCSVDLDTSAEFDLEAEVAKVISLFETTRGYTDSQPAINIIGYHIKNKIISPSSRYFYKGHVPLCFPLEGDEKYLSDLFITEIEKLVLE